MNGRCIVTVAKGQYQHHDEHQQARAHVSTSSHHDGTRSSSPTLHVVWVPAGGFREHALPQLRGEGDHSEQRRCCYSEHNRIATDGQSPTLVSVASRAKQRQQRDHKGQWSYIQVHGCGVEATVRGHDSQNIQS